MIGRQSNVCVYAVHTTIRKGRQFTGLSTFESMFRPCGRGEEIEEQALARGMEEFYFTFYGDKSQTMTVEKKIVTKQFAISILLIKQFDNLQFRWALLL